MKKLIVSLFVTALTTCAFSQGTVNFVNNPTTLISVGVPGNAVPTEANNSAAYYFGLLFASPGSSTFTFTGVYGTNQNAAGRFTGGNGVSVPGWEPGVLMDFRVAGWSADLGPVFNSSWLTQPPNGFGLSMIASNWAGGTTSNGQVLPNAGIFGGIAITEGFIITTLPAPSNLRLSITASGGTATISWSPAGGTLQSTTQLQTTGTVWSTVGTANPATVQIGADGAYATFFRVQQ